MSDPREHVSDLKIDDSLPKPPSVADQFADIPNTFEIWLEGLKPALEPVRNLVPAQLAVDETERPGELRFEGTLRVDCYVTGRLRSLTGTLIVGETAEVESDVVVATAIIDGVLRGDIHATERVELQSHARMTGNIESPALEIQPGAVFAGLCNFPWSLVKSAAGDSDIQKSQQTSSGDASVIEAAAVEPPLAAAS